MKEQSLRRALWFSTALLVVLGAAAFWPAKPWAPPARPALRAPIVFDELVSHAPPPNEPSTEP